MRLHHYKLKALWTGNRGDGTSHYRAYERNYVVQAEGKPDLYASADPTFRGDASRYNPEELLIAALSGCHMLSYFHVCALNGIVVTHYEDHAEGEMETYEDGSGKMIEVMLRPQITITKLEKVQLAMDLHRKAAELCFIANSVNFPVKHQPLIRVADEKNPMM